MGLTLIENPSWDGGSGGSTPGGGGVEPYTIIPKYNTNQQSITSSAYITWTTSGVEYQRHGSQITAGSGNNAFVIPSSISYTHVDIDIRFAWKSSFGATNMRADMQVYKNGAAVTNSSSYGSVCRFDSDEDPIKIFTGTFHDVPVSANDVFGIFVGGVANGPFNVIQFSGSSDQDRLGFIKVTEITQ